MQEKIIDLQSALDFRDMLVQHLRELKLPGSMTNADGSLFLSRQNTNEFDTT
jgi:hypothetical protein